MSVISSDKLTGLAARPRFAISSMSEEDNATCTTPVNKDSNISLLLTKDGQTYFVDKSGVVESRNVVTPQEPDNSFPFDMEDPGDESDVLETTDPRDSTASPEELNDDEAFGDSENVTKKCTYEGCTETTTQVAKQRKPWMCKKHRNKMYKDKYKKKKSDQAMSSGKLDVRMYYMGLLWIPLSKPVIIG